ncbi:MAG: hypothetical protein KC613_19360, partial [Myxococcales bacterium]|nr:hypothetical protein [Myxococcales bacterium]
MSGPAGRPGRLDLALLIDALRLRWIWVAVPAVLVPMLAVLAVKTVGPNRKASALILVRDDYKVAPVLQDVSVGVALSSRLPEVRSLVRSPQTVEAVLRSLGVVTAEMDELAVETTVSGFANRIEVYGEGGGLVRITLSGRSADLVSQALTLLTERVIQELLGPRRLALQTTTRFLKEQLDRVKSELDQVETELGRLSKDGTGYVPELRRVKVDAFRALSEALTEAESELAGVAGGAPPSAMNPKMAANLIQARASVRRLKQTYTDTHPAVVSGMADVARLEAQLGLAPGEQVPANRAGRGRDAAQSQRKVDFLRRRLAEAQVD